MRMTIFSNRVFKEILRDPVSLFFGIGFPIIVLLLLTMINQNVPNGLFNIGNLAPGIAVFSLSFLALFAAQILSKDRASSFLDRLYTTKLTSTDFITGYSLPIFVIAIVQLVICFATAMILGLHFTTNIFLTIVALLPISIIFIAIGLLCGTIFTEKAATTLCGAGLTNLCAFLSGAWFELSLVGGIFEDIGYLLPFAHAVDSGRAILSGNYANIFPHLWWVLGYAVVLYVSAIIIFKKRMIEVK